MDRYYIYRFLDKENNVLYIGRTNDISRRILKEHFSFNTHLPPECYLETECVEYAEFQHESEEVAYEAILINQIRPKYNTQFKDGAKFNVSLPTINWKGFEWEFENQIDILKVFKRSQVSIADATAVFLDQWERNAKNDYMSFGFQNVDEQSILMPCTTALIAAFSGEYKTAYALHVARWNAQLGKRVLYINLKDSADDLVKRLVFSGCLISNGDAYSGQITEKQWEKILEEMKSVAGLPITFYNHKEENGTIYALCEQIRKTDCDMVIIDDLNTIADFEYSYDDDKTLRAMKKIKGVALERRIPIISLYCLNNKNIQKRDDKRPLISDMVHSSLQSYSDIIQLIYHVHELNEIEIITAKSNIGSTGIAIVVPAGGSKLVEVSTELDGYTNEEEMK